MIRKKLFLLVGKIKNKLKKIHNLLIMDANIMISYLVNPKTFVRGASTYKVLNIQVHAIQSEHKKPLHLEDIFVKNFRLNNLTKKVKSLIIK